jgi:hypothetical protein
VSECDREASLIRRPCPTRGCCAIKMSCGFIVYKMDVMKPVAVNPQLILKRVDSNPLQT